MLGIRDLERAEDTLRRASLESERGARGSLPPPAQRGASTPPHRHASPAGVHAPSRDQLATLVQEMVRDEMRAAGMGGGGGGEAALQPRMLPPVALLGATTATAAAAATTPPATAAAQHAAPELEEMSRRLAVVEAAHQLDREEYRDIVSSLQRSLAEAEQGLYEMRQLPAGDGATPVGAQDIVHRLTTHVREASGKGEALQLRLGRQVGGVMAELLDKLNNVDTLAQEQARLRKDLGVVCEHAAELGSEADKHTGVLSTVVDKVNTVTDTLNSLVASNNDSRTAHAALAKTVSGLKAGAGGSAGGGSQRRRGRSQGDDGEQEGVLEQSRQNDLQSLCNIVSDMKGEMQAFQITVASEVQEQDERLGAAQKALRAELEDRLAVAQPQRAASVEVDERVSAAAAAMQAAQRAHEERVAAQLEDQSRRQLQQAPAAAGGAAAAGPSETQVRRMVSSAVDTAVHGLEVRVDAVEAAIDMTAHQLYTPQAKHMAPSSSDASAAATAASASANAAAAVAAASAAQKEAEATAARVAALEAAHAEARSRILAPSVDDAAATAAAVTAAVPSAVARKLQTLENQLVELGAHVHSTVQGHEGFATRLSLSERGLQEALGKTRVAASGLQLAQQRLGSAEETLWNLSARIGKAEGQVERHVARHVLSQAKEVEAWLSTERDARLDLAQKVAELAEATPRDAARVQLDAAQTRQLSEERDARRDLEQRVHVLEAGAEEAAAAAAAAA
eukprot:Rhum_TRINITY_DN14261_c9_g1::Rhum_TRINITY_DN14261_c9_g1_i1::g.77615::m.77615